MEIHIGHLILQAATIHALSTLLAQTFISAARSQASLCEEW